MTCPGVFIVSDDGRSDEYRCVLPAGHRGLCKDGHGVWLSVIETLGENYVTMRVVSW